MELPLGGALKVDCRGATSFIKQIGLLLWIDYIYVHALRIFKYIVITIGTIFHKPVFFGAPRHLVPYVHHVWASCWLPKI